MSRVARVAVLAAAVLSIAVGVREALRPPPAAERAPRWAAALAPLRRMPLAERQPAILAVPPALPRARSRYLLYEAFWQRPDVRWASLREWPDAPGQSLVTLGDAQPPPGWRLVRRYDRLALWRRRR